MGKALKGVRWIFALAVPAGLAAAPVTAHASGFGCGANNPLTQNTRPQPDVDRRTNSSSIDRERLNRELEKYDRETDGNKGFQRG